MNQQLPKLANSSPTALPQQMEGMKSHLTSLALEFMIMAGFYKDRDP